MASGNPAVSSTQLLPASLLKYTPNSVPQNNKSGLIGSSAMLYTEPRSGKVPDKEVQVLPLSLLRIK